MEGPGFETQPTPTSAAATTGRWQGTAFQRAGASALLALGLLTVGGVAIVNAASPTPSASTAPSATDNGSGGTGSQGGSDGSSSGQRADCPNM